MDEFDDDIAADIKAAQSELAGEVAEAPEPAAPEIEAEAPESDGRPRDERGRFAPKAKEEEVAEPVKAAAPKQETAPAEAAPTDEKPLTPPATWSAQAKAEFLRAPKAIQQEVLRREADMDKGRQEWQSKAETFNRLEKVIAPHREKWALNGFAEDQAIGQLLAAQQMLERDPVSAIAYLAQQYRVDLRRFAQPTNGQPQPQGPVSDPTVQQLMQQVQTLTQHFQQQQTAQETAHFTSLRSEVEAFKANPAHIYFDNVKDEVVAILRLGDQRGDTRPNGERLKDAYERACRANPEVWAIIQAEADQKAKAAVKAKEARHASGSVTGAPGPGKAAPSNRSPNDDLEDDIRAALRGASA